MKSLRESDAALSQNWYVACLSNELHQGRPIARMLYGKTYALFRDSQGAAGILEDRCPHRGTQLSHGRCDGDHLRCPYHGWAFDRSGSVVDIPSEGPCTSELSRKILGRGWKVASPPVYEQDGVIWVWTGEDEKGNPTSADPDRPTWRFPYHTNSSWTGYFMVTDFANEVGQLVQNFMDVPHTVFVHSGWFRKRTLVPVPYLLEVGEGSVKATYQNPQDSAGGITRRLLNPKDLPLDHTDEFIFPNLTRVDYRYGPDHGFVINSQCTPVDRFQSRVYTWITYRGSYLARMLKPLIRRYTRQVIEQDVRIMANQAENLKRMTETPKWKSTAADEIHLAIERIRQLGERDPRLALTRVESTSKERIFWI